MWFYGCSIIEPCGCSPIESEAQVTVVDGGAPVDSAGFVIRRASDDSLIDSLREGSIPFYGGTYRILGQEHISAFPARASDMDVRVEARRGPKRGQAILGLRMARDRGYFRKVSGPDTIRIQ